MRRKAKRLAAILGAAALLIVLAILTQYSSRHEAVVVVVIPRSVSHLPYSSNYWPSSIKVVIGINNTVKWINLDDHMHTVTETSWRFYSRELNMYDSFVMVFTEEGEYRYVCLPHPWMQGVVKVVKKD